MQKVLNETELPIYLSLKEFRRKVFPIAERTIWRMISTGEFPKPSAAKLAKALRLELHQVEGNDHVA